MFWAGLAGILVGTGYAGAPGYKDDPAAQALADRGPLPTGFYTIEAAYTDPHLGPVAMRLTPSPKNQMYGRGDFFIHADSISHPGAASHGCIEMPLTTRQLIAASTDRILQVVA